MPYVQLTNAVCDEATSPVSYRLYRDTVVDDLALRVTNAGVKTLVFASAQQPHIVIGSYPQTTLETARTEARRLKTEWKLAKEAGLLEDDSRTAEHIAFNAACRAHDSVTPVERLYGLWSAVLLVDLPEACSGRSFSIKSDICETLGVDEDWLHRKVQEYLAGGGLKRKTGQYTQSGAIYKQRPFQNAV